MDLERLLLHLIDYIKETITPSFHCKSNMWCKDFLQQNSSSGIGSDKTNHDVHIFNYSNKNNVQLLTRSFFTFAFERGNSRLHRHSLDLLIYMTHYVSDGINAYFHD